METKIPKCNKEVLATAFTGVLDIVKNDTTLFSTIIYHALRALSAFDRKEALISINEMLGLRMRSAMIKDDALSELNKYGYTVMKHGLYSDTVVVSDTNDPVWMFTVDLSNVNVVPDIRYGTPPEDVIKTVLIELHNVRMMKTGFKYRYDEAAGMINKMIPHPSVRYQNVSIDKQDLGVILLNRLPRVFVGGSLHVLVKKFFVDVGVDPVSGLYHLMHIIKRLEENNG